MVQPVDHHFQGPTGLGSSQDDYAVGVILGRMGDFPPIRERLLDLGARDIPLPHPLDGMHLEKPRWHGPEFNQDGATLNMGRLPRAGDRHA
jgi:hypothetical protein